MKSGDAIALHTFATLAADPALTADITVMMYDCEEVAAEFNGLNHLVDSHPEWFAADLAILHEPSGGVIEAGCQGTLRIKVHAVGTRAHSARAWLGDNAIHHLAPVLAALQAYTPRRVEITGCEYREGLQAVRMSAGVAGNTVPDAAWVEINFRFAPDRSLEEAFAHVYAALGLDPAADCPQRAHNHLWVEVTDAAGGALPGLDRPAAQGLIAATGGAVRAKFGWTDVSRFAELGVAAVNYGPGDPALCHKPEEHCPTAQIRHVADTLKTFLTT